MTQTATPTIDPEQKRELLQQVNADPQYRTATLKPVVPEATREEGDPEVKEYELSFSSEEPYERYWGVEVLGHKEEEVEMGWIKSGHAPLLLQHDPDRQIGVVKQAAISNARGRAVIRFGAGALAKEIQQDVDDGIRGNVSVGYRIKDLVLVEERENEPPIYRVTKWEPMEVSIVSIPADRKVGVGRQQTPEPKTVKVKVMSEESKKTDTTDIVTQERNRIAEIQRYGEQHSLPADFIKEHVTSGTSLDQFKGVALDKIIEQKAHKPVGADPDSLSKQEKKDLGTYSLRKAILGGVRGELSGIEREMHQEACKDMERAGKSVSGVGVPFMILNQRGFFQQRDLTATGGDTGDKLVPTNLLSGSWIDVLRNALVFGQLGPTILDGLSGNIAIPRITAGTSHTEEGENDAAAETTPTMDQVTMTPHRISAKVEYSLQLLAQSSLSVEALLRADLAISAATKLQNDILNGASGGDNITGLRYTSGLGEVTNGAAGGVPTFGKFVDMETEVATDNALMGNLGYIINATTRGFCKQTDVGTDTGRMIMDRDGTINGYPVAVTNALPNNLTKGAHTATDLSAALFGNWRDLLIGFWGGLDLITDRFTRADEALVRLISHQYADAKPRHAESFSKMEDIDVISGDSIT